jgi:hypothetical protein
MYDTVHLLTEMVSAVIEHGASNLQDLAPCIRPLAEVFVFVGTKKRTTNVGWGWGGSGLKFTCRV